jgi:zinc transport system substrate-binding protein
MVKVGSIGLVVAGFMACFLSSPARANEPPAAVASIKPLHSLVAGVMEGVGEPYLLVQGGGSPHGYVMRPTDARMLANARLIFWVGEGMETFLMRPIKTLGEHADVVELGRAPGIVLLPLREGGAWDSHAHEEHAEHEGHDGHEEHSGHEEHEEGEEHGDSHGHDHGEGAFDMHVWLDPQNAGAMADAIADSLAKADPARAEIYRANALQLQERLWALDGELARSLAPVKDRPYIVFHDAYPYLEGRYNLSPVGSITLDPHHAPGAKRLIEIRDKIRETGALCVFTEPQFSPGVAETVVEGSQTKLGVLDPLGAEIADGPDLYFNLLENLGENLRNCLLSES